VRALTNPITQAQVASAMGRRTNKTLTDDRLAKLIAAQQAAPLRSHVNPNMQSGLQRSATNSATGDAIMDAICERIGIQDDVDRILELGKSHLEVQEVMLKVGSQRLHFKDANDKIKACTQHLQNPVGGRLINNERNAARDVAESFVSGSTACDNTGAHVTDQDCVSYVYHRTLFRIAEKKRKNKDNQDPKNNGGAGGRSLPH